MSATQKLLGRMAKNFSLRNRRCEYRGSRHLNLRAGKNPTPIIHAQISIPESWPRGASSESPPSSPRLDRAIRSNGRDTRACTRVCILETEGHGDAKLKLGCIVHVCARARARRTRCVVVWMYECDIPRPHLISTWYAGFARPPAHLARRANAPTAQQRCLPWKTTNLALTR